jgi:plasmid stability protein
MTTITLKNIPDEIYSRLKKTAQRHRRSLNSEIIVCLEKSLEPTAVRVEDVLVTARRLRGRVIGPPLTLDEIAEARRLGRP